MVINSDWCRKHVAKHSVGAIQGHFNVEALKEVPVPRIERTAQDELVTRVHVARARAGRLAAALEQQIELLREHRQTLITAAVTGQLDVGKVAA
jgi:type I restriction enzyme S subunit